ncbi:hypothetical protein [Desulfotruncus alcoholivorax]|uniref:hypothetical protein n=1 Tax=Desulfotruncus alcoholivorax TaxID=265477 RepID=UPI000408FCEC|nr:hypothetical protein [Desulfotruncus alcoholivorax]
MAGNNYKSNNQDVNLSVLSKPEINVLKSDYVNAFDEALVILERAQQINSENIIDNS